VTGGMRVRRIQDRLIEEAVVHVLSERSYDGRSLFPKLTGANVKFALSHR
jgi:hypothetical protein